MAADRQRAVRPGKAQAAGKPTTKSHPQPDIYMIQKSVSGPLVQSEAKPQEDVFQQFVILKGDKAVITPPVEFYILARWANQNTILEPLISAMEVNIDGTGAELVPIEPEEIDEDADAAHEASEEEELEAKENRERVEREKAGLESYFDESWWGESFLTVRRRLRRDQETLGNAYLEIIRNVGGQIAFMRWLDAKSIRLVRLDEPVEVPKKVVRDGQESTINVLMQERRFVQRLGTKLVWFKEFGASRDLHKATGDWSEVGQKLAADERSTELIHFTIKTDIGTPYGLPRWWNNMPSVVGSRKAEEFNLEFFDAGGVPPLLIIVSGGKMATNTEQALREHFTALGQKRHQAAILEAYSVDGDIDSAQNVRVTVERFGSDRQKDMLFQKYIEGCDSRVQRGFRLPSIFLGMADGINFATALASMMVAEAQVFACERKEFDEVINLKLMPELPNGEGFEYRSKGLSMRDGTLQLKALELAASSGAIDSEGLRKAIEEVVDLPLAEPKEPEDEGPDMETRMATLEAAAQAPAPGGVDEAGRPIKGGVPQAGAPPKPPSGEGPKQAVVRAEVLTGLRSLAEDAVGTLAEDGMQVDTQKAVALIQKLATLNAGEAEVFKQLLGTVLYPEFAADPVGAGEMATCTLAALLRNAAGQEADAAGI